MYINIFYILYLIYIYTYIYTNKMKVIDNPIILFFLQLIYTTAAKRVRKYQKSKKVKLYYTDKS